MLDERGPAAAAAARVSLVLPRALLSATLWCLDHAARTLVTVGVTANAITVLGLCLAALAGVLLSLGHFALATAAMVVASLSDALDGLVARRSGTASVAGALLDASVDRYEEFFFLGGIAVFYRDSVPALVLALLAIAGSFMVSYGSAKAEALNVPVPAGVMRRAERAACLCVAAGMAALFAWMGNRSLVPAWAARAPLIAALVLIGVVANVSAIRRLYSLAHGGSVVKLRPSTARRRVLTEARPLEAESRRSSGSLV
jgi:CDP-diacylglycerol--glycerol-3-phosphate 3-phosphatidyltransferase